MDMPGRKTEPIDNYKYSFNGKLDDKSDGWQTQDYGFRAYDYRLGKFFSQDPLRRQYAYLTPYQFAGNRPIVAIDLDGSEAWDAPNGIDVLSQYSWEQFVAIFTNDLKTTSLGKKKDKDCADLAIEYVVKYFQQMGVQLTIDVPGYKGANVNLDSNDPKYAEKNRINEQGKIVKGKDISGKVYESGFEWFLEDVKLSVGPNGIPNLSYLVKSNELNNGDVILLKDYFSGSFFHTMVVTNGKNEKSVVYIQASGKYKGKNSPENSFDDPLIRTGVTNLKGFSTLYRWNFLKNLNFYSNRAKSEELKSIPIIHPDFKEPEQEIKLPTSKAD